jgi:hypothetical protein
MTDHLEPDSAPEQLENTADNWRDGPTSPAVQDSADEVARGAERGAEQPDYGIEGN